MKTFGPKFGLDNNKENGKIVNFVVLFSSLIGIEKEK
jgi:hypothetical protein